MSEYGNLVINGNFCAEKELNNGDLIVKVEDEGPGIPYEDSERVFKSFWY